MQYQSFPGVVVGEHIEQLHQLSKTWHLLCEAQCLPHNA